MARLDYRAKSNEIQRLKAYGHDLIDDLLAKGFSKDRVYNALRVRLGCARGNEHFSAMWKIRELHNAIEILEDMNERAVWTPSKKKKKPKPKSLAQMLDDAEKQKRKEDRKEQQEQKKQNKELNRKLDKEKLRAELRRVSRINTITAKFPAPLRPFVLRIVSALLK